MRLAILSNVNLDMLSGLLKKEYEVFLPEGYGGWVTYALGRREDMAAFGADCIFLLLDGAALMRGLSEGEYEEAMDKTLQYIRGLADNYEQSLLFVSTLDFLPERVAAGDAADAGLLAAALWERKLAVLLAENLRIHRFPLRELIAGCGRSRFYSRKFWYMGSIPYDMQGLHLLAEEIGKCLSRVKRARCKVLVTDLDNTLWGGVIGEDGVEGIVLDGAHQGAVYQDAQRQLLRMKEQGVLLAVASKNNREDVCAACAHPQMLLKEEDKEYWNNDDCSYYIHHLVTDSNLKGIGKKLIEFAKEQCKENDKKYLRLDCYKESVFLNKYYKNLGFHNVGNGTKGDYHYSLWEMKI